jgi:hypothetical protein
LAELGKPLHASMINEAFGKILAVNDDYPNIEVTANFVIGKGLSAEHYESVKELLRTASISSKGKGVVYLSPLQNSPKKRELLPLVNEIREQSKLPVYIYLIQRL